MFSQIINYREEQLSKQHATELANQRDYMQRAEHELCKKHSLQLKQQPKSLKVTSPIWSFYVCDNDSLNFCTDGSLSSYGLFELKPRGFV